MGNKGNINNRFKKLISTYEDIKKKLSEEGKKEFLVMSKEIFDSIPNMNSFSFIGYTPHFSDGDTCYFGVHSYPESVSINGIRGEEAMEEESENIGITEEDYEKVANMLDEIPSEIIQGIFGDHFEVTIYKDKEPVIEEYEHD